MRARKPWISKDVLRRMDECSERMSTMKKEERTTEKMRKTLKRARDKTKKKYLESVCDEVMEFQETGR
jgi:hypothetical protein